MTTLPGLFETVEKENKLYHDIKIKTSAADKINATLMFNYYLYNAIYGFYKNTSSYGDVRNCLRNFIIKEDNLNPSIAAINNTYQMAIMLDTKNLTDLLIGKPSKLLNLSSDAAKLGALLALHYRLYGVGKLDMLSETLFLA